ncbi:MAG: hypothetical protein QXG05_01530 [Nitrososphaerota archaeon]
MERGQLPKGRFRTGLKDKPSLVRLAEAKRILYDKIEIMLNIQTYELFIEDLELPERYLIGEEMSKFK